MPRKPPISGNLQNLREIFSACEEVRPLIGDDDAAILASTYQKHWPAYMKLLRAEHNAGDISALADAIHACARAGQSWPSWVADAYCAGWLAVQQRTTTWADVLGKVKAKTLKQIQREKRDRDQLFALLNALPSLRAPITRDNDSGLWAEISERIGVGTRRARELYDRLRKLFGPEYVRQRLRKSSPE